MNTIAYVAAGACLFWQTLTFANHNNPHRLINGQEVSLSEWAEVVRLDSGCTATVVGPRVIATAGHCAQSGSQLRFSTAGQTYRAQAYRHPSYVSSGAQNDITIAITDKEITGVEPASFGGSAYAGLEITLLGYGCIYSGGSGGNDGILRMGTAKVTHFSGTDMVSRGGAALCYGDSGGPAFVFENDRRLLLGINSKGNIHDTSYNMRTDLQSARQFVEGIAAQQNVDICGINTDC